MSARRGVVVAAAVVVAGLLTAAPAPAGTSGPNVYIVDNAFVRVIERPVLRVRPGTVVTWNWRSRQSHSVLVRSGPEQFETRTRNRGAFHHRFRKIGTYRIVCALHAPGMKMTVVVAR